MKIYNWKDRLKYTFGNWRGPNDAKGFIIMVVVVALILIVPTLLG